MQASHGRRPAFQEKAGTKVCGCVCVCVRVSLFVCAFVYFSGLMKFLV